jgi:hypothetical protein
MSVTNELTSEVTAVILRKEGLSDPKELRQLLLVFHTSLRSLALEERQRRRAKLSSATLSSRNKSASSNISWR